MAKSNKNTDLTEICSQVNERIPSKIGVIGVKEVLNTFMDVVRDEVYAGKVVRLQKLGTFDTKLMPPRTYESQLPKLKGQIIETPAMFVPTFKYSPTFKNVITAKKAHWNNG